MKTHTLTVSEGEWFTDGTPDEWFAAHTAACRDGSPRDLTDEQKAMVRILASEPPSGMMWLVCTYEVWHRLLAVGLYDGWVYWRPRLYVGFDGTLGFEGAEGYELRNIAIGQRTEEKNWLGQRFRLVTRIDDPIAYAARHLTTASDAQPVAAVTNSTKENT